MKSEKKQGQELLIANEGQKLKPGYFGIHRDHLIDLVSATQQNRAFDEELVKIHELGGLNKILDQLHTNGTTGISATNEDLQARDEAFGNNKKQELETQTFWQLLWAALGDLMLRVLVLAAIISITVAMAYPEKAEDRTTGWIDGFAILVAVFVCSVVAAANDYQKEKQFKCLNETAENGKQVRIVRGGEVQQMRCTEIMVGDLIQVEEGMQLPADGLLIQASEIKCDESAMTGETDMLKKQSFEDCVKRRDEFLLEDSKDNAKPHDIPSPILLSGTQIVQGEGLFIAIVVGDYSSEGKIQKILRQQESESTPLQQKLEAIAEDIGKFGLISAILIVSVLLIRFIIEKSINGWDEFDGGSIQELLRFLSIGVAIVVVAIPEGLPLSVTISLAYSVKKMLNDKNLVRKLQACETMGGADMICSDKTGTLTQNKMTLQQIWNQKIISLEYDNINMNQIVQSEEIQLLLAQSISCNSTAITRPKEIGNKTEISLLNFLDKTQFKYEDIKSKYDVIHRYPLTSSRKRMSTIIDINGRKRLLVKGASELLLDACTEYQDFSGIVHQLDDNVKKEIYEEGINAMANNALRTLVLAYKDILDRDVENIQEDSKGVKEIEKSNLRLICVVGIKDALRKEVKSAVEKCKIAGIKVRMVTGDFKLTARAIAIECGITVAGDSSRITMEGQQFIERIGGVVCEKCRTQICGCPTSEAEKSKLEKKNGGGEYTVRIDVIDKFDEFKKIVPRLDVLARSRPEDKYALVTGLKQMGHVVAVTGDGTNDAPALKKSDVGFSMGIAGTQVAREASDIVLLDDNFNSIVKAVIWGRNIYDSIKKFLQFQLTVNLVAVISSLVSSAITKQETLTVIQMLWVNLIMDSLAALALATEPPTEKLLERKPHKRDEYIISRKMMKHIIGQALFQITVLMIFIFAGPNFLPEYDDSLDDHIQEKLDNNDAEYIERGGFNMKYRDAINSTGEMKFIRSGRLKMLSESSISNGDIKEQFKGQDYDYNVDLIGHSRHFTYVFNVFVWMQILNFFNARKLNDEFNILSGILKNSFFIIIVAVIIFIEVIVITFGGKAFQCYEWVYFLLYNINIVILKGHGGLTIIQWLICLGFSALGFFVSFILKLIPESQMPKAGKKELEPQNSLVRSLRGSSKIKQSLSMDKPEKQGSQLQQKKLSVKQIPVESEMAELDLKY